MSEDIKKQEFLDYLEENVWREVERVGGRILCQKK